MRRALTIAAFLLAACGDSNTLPPALQATKESVAGVCKDSLAVILSPLEDLNLKREPIPNALQDCAMNPYAMPLPPVCENIAAEVTRLDEVLGPDMQPAPLPWLAEAKTGKYSVKQGIAQGRQMAQQQAVGVVASKVNVIPFRGAIRKVSGAEKHRKEVERAYEAGKLRRAFLKGIAATQGCNDTP